MKEVTLSTGQTATIRSKDELTEGQSRKIEIARSRGAAVFARYGKPVYVKPDPESTAENPKPDITTFENTGTRAKRPGGDGRAVFLVDVVDQQHVGRRVVKIEIFAGKLFQHGRGERAE